MKRLFVAAALLAALLFSLAAPAQKVAVPKVATAPTRPSASFSLHSAGVIGSYRDGGSYVSLSATAQVYHSDTSHFANGTCGIGGANVRFNASVMNIAVITPPTAVINYDGTYWHSTPSVGAGTPATLTFTTDKGTKKFFVLITRRDNGGTLYSFTGAFVSGSITMN